MGASGSGSSAGTSKPWSTGPRDGLPGFGGPIAREPTDRHDFVTRFGASPNRHVTDFLAAEVLEAHDPKMQALMLGSSILRQAVRSVVRCGAGTEALGPDA